MYKESRVATGLIRIVTVLLVLAFLYMELLIIAQTKAQDSFSYVGQFNQIVTYPGKPFDFSGFLLLTVGNLIVLYIILLICIFIINGFRTKVKDDHKDIDK